MSRNISRIPAVVHDLRSDASSTQSSHPFSVDITRCTITGASLVIQYRVSPVPPELALDRRRYEGEDVGIAVDNNRHTCRLSRSAYRVSADRSYVAGALRLGPARWPTVGLIRVLFAPLAYTPHLGGLLTEACLTVDANHVRSASLRTR